MTEEKLTLSEYLVKYAGYCKKWADDMQFAYEEGGLIAVLLMPDGGVPDVTTQIRKWKESQ